MKRIIKHFLTLCAGLIAVICIAACGESHTPSSSKELEQLKMPTHLKADFWELTWEDVENANGYTVRIFEDEYQTDETEFSLFEYLSPNKRYTLDVKANGDGENYADSEWESVIYQTEKVTENLTVRLLNEKDYSPLTGIDGLAGTYEVSIYPNKIPADGKLVLPDYINGKPVTSYNVPRVLNTIFRFSELKAIRLPAHLKQITGGGFRDSSVREVYIPNGVEYVSGFTDCKKLTKINLPDTITYLDAFSGCSALSQIELPNGLITIGAYSFKDTNLTSLEIPRSVKSVGEKVLLNTPWYNEQADGFVYCGDVLCGYKGDILQITELKESDFKSGVRLIAGNIFENNPNLKSVEIPDSVEGLGEWLFSECTALESVKLSKNLERIDKRAFWACERLTTIDLPETLTEIGVFAFSECGLKSVDLPSGIKEIEQSLFDGCSVLENVNLKEGLLQIGLHAFAQCKKLPNLVLPSTIKSIRAGAFSYCTSLTSVLLPQGLTEISAGMFQRCTSLKKIKLPENLVKIDMNAFEKTALEVIAIPASVKEIGYSAFAGTKLTSVVLPKSLETLGYAVFGNCENLTNIVVSSECSGLEVVDFYKATALKKFYYTGTQTQWEEKGLPMGDVERLYKDVAMFFYGARSEQSVREEISAWEQNLTVYFYSEVEPIGAGNFWHYDKDGKPVEW